MTLKVSRQDATQKETSRGEGPPRTIRCKPAKARPLGLREVAIFIIDRLPIVSVIRDPHIDGIRIAAATGMLARVGAPNSVRFHVTLNGDRSNGWQSRKDKTVDIIA